MKTFRAIWGKHVGEYTLAEISYRASKDPALKELLDWANSAAIGESRQFKSLWTRVR